MWKTGHSLIKEKMKEVHCPVAGELSGHICFGEDYYGFDDALYGACKLAEMLSRSDKTLSQMVDEFPKYVSTPEIRLEVEEERKFDIVRDAIAEFSKDHEVNSVDGARVSFEGGWGLLRASNTQPVLVMRYEARTAGAAREDSRDDGRLAESKGVTKRWTLAALITEPYLTTRDMLRSNARVFLIAGIALLALLAMGRAAVDLYTDALWFDSLGFRSIFLTRLAVSALVRLGTGSIGAAFVLLNLWLVTRQLGPVHLRRRYGNLEIAEQVPRGYLFAGTAAACVARGLVAVHAALRLADIARSVRVAASDRVGRARSAVRQGRRVLRVLAAGLRCAERFWTDRHRVDDDARAARLRARRRGALARIEARSR